MAVLTRRSVSQPRANGAAHWWHPQPAAVAGAADVAEIVLQNEDSTPPMTVSKPAAFATGQRLIFLVVDDSGVLADLTAPAGWTPITGGSVDITGQRGNAWYHDFDGTEPSTWDFGYTSGAAVDGALLRITNPDLATAPVAATGNSASNAATMDSPSVNPSGASDLLIVAMSNSGANAAFSAADPSGTTDLGQTQVSNLFQGLMVAKQQLPTNSPTGVRTWTSISPTARQAGTWSIAIKSTVSTGIAETGLVTIGLAATVTAQKVAAVTARSALGATGTAATRKVAAATGAAAVGLAARTTSVKVAPRTALAALGACVLATTRKTAPAVGVSPAGLSARPTTIHVSTRTGTSTLALTGYKLPAGADIRAVTGTARLGVTSTAATLKVAVDNGRATLGTLTRATTLHIATCTGTAPLGLTGRASTLKLATPLGRATIGLTGRGTAAKLSPSLGQTTFGLIGTSTTRKVASGAQQQATLGLSATLLPAAPPVIPPPSVSGRIMTAKMRAMLNYTPGQICPICNLPMLNPHAGLEDLTRIGDTWHVVHRTHHIGTFPNPEPDPAQWPTW
jgi:hypothetical protein